MRLCIEREGKMQQSSLKIILYQNLLQQITSKVAAFSQKNTGQMR